jgi:hypothetical protein
MHFLPCDVLAVNTMNRIQERANTKWSADANQTKQNPELKPRNDYAALRSLRQPIFVSNGYASMDERVPELGGFTPRKWLERVFK